MNEIIEVGRYVLSPIHLQLVHISADGTGAHYHVDTYHKKNKIDLFTIKFDT